ncbi:hypothetical protein J6590_003913 [Homalodisca vitripennis]|nr:hypothetical protein J6590_003913 [Homalodisca vitripennis]
MVVSSLRRLLQKSYNKLPQAWGINKNDAVTEKALVILSPRPFEDIINKSATKKTDTKAVKTGLQTRPVMSVVFAFKTNSNEEQNLFMFISFVLARHTATEVKVSSGCCTSLE